MLVNELIREEVIQNHEVSIVDMLTNKTIRFNFIGKKKEIFFDGKSFTSIVNEYDVPLFIKTYNTLSINSFDIK